MQVATILWHFVTNAAYADCESMLSLPHPCPFPLPARYSPQCLSKGQDTHPQRTVAPQSRQNSIVPQS